MEKIDIIGMPTDKKMAKRFTFMEDNGGGDYDFFMRLSDEDFFDYPGVKITIKGVNDETREMQQVYMPIDRKETVQAIIRALQFIVDGWDDTGSH